MLKKLYLIAIIVLLVGGFFAPSSISNLLPEKMEIYGSLSGFITDNKTNPIDSVRVFITCGDFTFECFSNENGYYCQDNIPLLFCLWNVSAFKPGYEIVYVVMPIGENSTYDFILNQTDKACLSGYITDQYKNRIKGAKVTISCGDTFECYSDETGYYIKDNLPLLFCIWNVSVYKEGYEFVFIEIPIVQNSTYDFILTPAETKDGIILLLAFPTEFYEYETNYTFMCPGRGHGIWITSTGFKYQKICGAIIEKDKFFGIANNFIILGLKIR